MPQRRFRERREQRQSRLEPHRGEAPRRWGISDSASGTCSFGGTCEVVVSDSGNPGIGLDVAVTFATPTVSVKEASNVEPNYVDKVTARNSRLATR